MEAKPILVLDDREELQYLIEMHIESEFNLPITFTSTMEDAVAELNSDKKYSLVISYYNLKAGSGSKLFELMQQHQHNLPFLMLTPKIPEDDKALENFQTANNKNAYIVVPFQPHDFVSAVGNALQIIRPSPTEGYRRIAGKKLAAFVKKNIPIYIIDQNNEYVQIDMTQYKDLDQIVAQYKTQGHDYFYTTTAQYELFCLLINKEFRLQLDSSKVPISKKLDIQLEAVEGLHSTLREIGLSEEEIALGEASTKATINHLQKKERISKILGRIIGRKGYTYELAILTSYLSAGIVMHTEWYTHQTMEKLSFASLLQDASLTKEELVKITAINSPDYLLLSAFEQKKVKEHPLESIKLLNEIEDFSNDIKNLIKYHHERPNKTGFPYQLDSFNTSPLSCIFNIAHEFAHRLIIEPLTKERLELTLVHFQQDYTKGNYRKAYEAFISLFRRRGKGNNS